MAHTRTWDIEEIAERRKTSRIRAAVSTATTTVILGLATALSPVSVQTISAATPDYSVVKVERQTLHTNGRVERRQKGEFDPDMPHGISTVRLGQGVPAFFRQTDPDEVEDIDLPPL
jgi:hypothetical protein